jgi:hypothetical protein
MRVILAFLVMGWVGGLVYAMASGETASIMFYVLYLLACVYGVFLRGLALGMVACVFIGIGLEALFLVGSSGHVPPLVLLPVLFWSALAIFAGDLFRAE